MDYFIGQIIMIAFDYVPDGFLLCDGSLYQADYYPALYSVLGNRFGGEPPQFATPDLRGRIPLGQNNQPVADGLPSAPFATSGGSINLNLYLDVVSASVEPGPTQLVAATGAYPLTYIPPFLSVNFAICAEGGYYPVGT